MCSSDYLGKNLCTIDDDDDDDDDDNNNKQQQTTPTTKNNDCGDYGVWNNTDDNDDYDDVISKISVKVNLFIQEK